MSVMTASERFSAGKVAPRPLASVKAGDDSAGHEDGPRPDLFLARRAAAGQTDAWAEIVETFGRRIFNIAFQFAANVAEAEDLTQDIFLRLYQNLHKYRGDVPLVGWALRLSRNLCIDHYRRVRSERKLTFVSEEILMREPGVGDPQADARRREELQMVYEVLQTMPEAMATVVTLRDLQSWTYAEMTAFLELPEGTVKSRLRRGRIELKRRIDDRLDRTGAKQ